MSKLSNKSLSELVAFFGEKLADAEALKAAGMTQSEGGIAYPNQCATTMSQHTWADDCSDSLGYATTATSANYYAPSDKNWAVQYNEKPHQSPLIQHYYHCPACHEVIQSTEEFTGNGVTLIPFLESIGHKCRVKREPVNRTRAIRLEDYDKAE